MAAALLMGSVPALAWQAPEDDAWQAASREGVAARFFVGSDVHIGRNSDADAKLTNALNVFEEIDPQADGVLLVGDVTNNGAASEYDRLMELIRANPLSEKVVLAMGNHEYNNASGAVERFESKTGQETNEVRYYRDDSGALTATVVKLGASNYGGNYTGSYDMLKTALETATAENAEAPVIVLGHHGIRNTAYVTHEWYGNYGEGTDRDMVALMKEYPQVIHISGHSHSTLEDARSIYQDDGYTAIQDSTIGAYFENESGKVDPNTGSGATRPVDSEESSQALRIDVMEDGTVDIYRLDLTDGDYMYAEEPWTFDANDASDRPYTSARAEQSDVPSFAADAAVTVSAVTKNSAVVHFPAAQAAFDKALSDAKAVLEKANPSQAEVDAAWDALLEGIWALGLVKGDVTMLEQLVAKAEAMVAEQDKYVQTDWQQLVDALAQAQELLADSGNALAGDVGEASEALLNAILAQRYKAHKENLEDILNQAQAVDLSGYTAQSVAVFQAALAEAQAVMADETLSVEDQDAVDAAMEALASAMNGLTAETTPQPTQTPEASQTPEATQKPVVSEAQSPGEEEAQQFCEGNKIEEF